MERTTHKAEVTSLRQTMAELRHGLDDIAAEVRRRWRYGRLASYRLAVGLTQQQAADRFNERSRDPEAAMSKTRLSRLERWPDQSAARPSVYTLLIFSQVYGTSPAMLIDPDHVELLSSREQALLRETTERSASLPHPHVTLVDTRSEGVGDAASVGSGGPTDRGDKGQVRVAAWESAEFAERVTNGGVGTDTIRLMYGDLARAARRYVHEPPSPIVSDMAAVRNHAIELLGRTVRTADRRELFTIVGAACAMLAHASDDLGDRGAALAQANTALVCAQESGHTGLLAWVYGTLSMIHEWGGSPHHAIEYARSGLEAASSTSGMVRLSALQARAWAQLGEQAEATAALNRAAELRWERQQVRDELDEIGGILTFPEAKQHYYAGATLVRLGEATAGGESDAAIEAYQVGPAEERSYGDECYARIDLALSHVRHGKLEEALAAATPVLALPVDRRLAGMEGYLRRVHVELTRPPVRSSPIGRAFRDQIEAYLAVPVRRALA